MFKFEIETYVPTNWNTKDRWNHMRTKILKTRFKLHGTM